MTFTLYIGNDPDPNDRIKIEISREDYERIPPRGSDSQEIVAVTDQASGKQYKVRRASCGLDGCRCALELVHNEDSDCLVDKITGCCWVCGVDHSSECSACGGRGFHKSSCHVMAEEERGTLV